MKSMPAPRAYDDAGAAVQLLHEFAFHVSYRNDLDMWETPIGLLMRHMLEPYCSLKLEEYSPVIKGPHCPKCSHAVSIYDSDINGCVECWFCGTTGFEKEFGLLDQPNENWD